MPWPFQVTSESVRMIVTRGWRGKMRVGTLNVKCYLMNHLLLSMILGG
jgi:hypothetical protein